LGKAAFGLLGDTILSPVTAFTGETATTKKIVAGFEKVGEVVGTGVDIVNKVANAPINLAAKGVGKIVELATGSKTIGKYVEAGVKIGVGVTLAATGAVNPTLFTSFSALTGVPLQSLDLT
jgi:hypothetical protein